MRYNHKFSGRLLTQRELRERRETRVAHWAAVIVCIVAFYAFGGAGWPMLIAALLTYSVIRFRQLGRQRE